MVNAKTGVKLRNTNNTNGHASPSPPPHTGGSAKKETVKSPIRLLSWDDLPAWRRDNSFILTGYRPHAATVANVFSSLLHLHNESVNIWSHLLGSLASVLLAASLALLTRHVVLPRWPSAGRADAAVFAAFLGGAAACMGMSAAFHALLSHSRGAARWGNKLDYTGIVALIVGSYVPALYYGFFCEPRLMEVYMSLVRFPPSPQHTYTHTHIYIGVSYSTSTPHTTTQSHIPTKCRKGKLTWPLGFAPRSASWAWPAPPSPGSTGSAPRPGGPTAPPSSSPSASRASSPSSTACACTATPSSTGG